MPTTPSTTSHKLQVRQLRKTFGGFVALHGADLDVAEGEFVTLLGPSGSGKTTLLLAIAGLNEPDAGEIRIDGRLATYLPPYKRDIGMVFQNYALFPHMSVYENIAFPLRMRRRSESEIGAAVQRVLDIIRLPEIAQRLPGQLSGGQQQRVALARALVYEPSIVLMDEPLGALDKKLRDQLQLEIKRLHEQLGISVLYVTHDQEEALVMSDRICLMHDGEIEQLGTPDELYFRPRTLFAADFLGESNLLDGRLEAVDETEGVVRLDDGTLVCGQCVPGLTVGGRVSVMVRPEALNLVTETRPDLNVIEAAFVERVMTGSTTKFFFRGAGGEEIRMQRLTTGQTDDAAGLGTVRLGWHPERCVVLARE
jgi:putative spermidine/putrescine transport system ATP-binding protein